MTEHWKPIYNNAYLISSCGRLYSTKRKIFRALHDNGSGYLIACISQNGKVQSPKIHRLVASAFLEKPAGCNIVNHIDLNTKNNNASNLEWVTQKKNVRHSVVNGRYQQKLTRAEMRQIIERVNNGERQSAVAKEFYVDQSLISRAVNQKSYKSLWNNQN